MKYRVSLNEEDIIKVIADRFEVLPDDVRLEHFTESQGYGMAERYVAKVSAEVESDDPLSA